MCCPIFFKQMPSTVLARKLNARLQLIIATLVIAMPATVAANEVDDFRHQAAGAFRFCFRTSLVGFSCRFEGGEAISV